LSVWPRRPTSRALPPERIAAFVNLVSQEIGTADIQSRKACLQVVAPESRVDDGKIQVIDDKPNLATVTAGQ